MKFLTGIFFISIIIFTSCVKKQYPLTREEVIAVIRKFDDGWQHKDIKMVDSVLAPSYIYFTQSGGIFSRPNLVQTAGSSSYSLDTMSRTQFFVELYENTAVVSTRWQGKGRYNGVNFNEDQRCSITIIKANNKVQILSEHCTPVKPNRVIH